MIIGAYLDRAAPEHAAGAEWSIQDAFAWLAGRGHDCRVMARKGDRRAIVNGVKVWSRPSEEEVAQHWIECDVMLTQLDASPDAQILAFTYQTPLVQMIHSASQLEQFGVVSSCRALTVFNAAHVARDCDWWDGPSLTLRPPVDADRVRCEARGVCATLVNVSHPKGGMTLYRLAERMEGTYFMGVRGAYGEQMMGPDGMPGTEFEPTPTGLPPNLKVFHSVEQIGSGVLAFTRVLLVLSMTETYGRVAAEANVSGIPVIAALTPGLHEACGDAAHYVEHRDDLHDLVPLIRRAYTAEWAQWSADALDQAALAQRRQKRELHRFLGALTQIVNDPPEMRL